MLESLFGLTLDRPALHRLLNPSFVVEDRGEQIALEVSKFGLMATLIVPLLLGYVPLVFLVYYFADQLPGGAQFHALFFAATSVPPLFLAAIVRSLWRQRECIAFDNRSTCFIVGARKTIISRDQVRCLVVQTRKHEDPHEGTVKVIELLVTASNEHGEIQSHFVAGGNPLTSATRRRLRTAADEFAALTGLAPHQVQEVTD